MGEGVIGQEGVEDTMPGCPDPDLGVAIDVRASYGCADKLQKAQGPKDCRRYLALASLHDRRSSLEHSHGVGHSSTALDNIHMNYCSTLKPVVLVPQNMIDCTCLRLRIEACGLVSHTRRNTVSLLCTEILK